MIAFVPIILAILRILLCFLPQTGYLHPDEMFQSADIMGGRFFDSKVIPAWEFKSNKPIRCMLIPWVLNSLSFRIAWLFNNEPSAYILLALPRLLYTILSFIVDICLWKICRYHSSRGLWYLPVSTIFQSSFICLGCMTRTLSNTVEVVLFSVLLLITCELIKPRFRILFVTPNGRASPAFEMMKGSKQLLSSFSIGIILSIGLFNRPTFILFAMIPLLYWLCESFRRNLSSKRLTIARAIMPLSLSFIATSFAQITFDTYYYKGFQTTYDTFRLLTTLNYHKFIHNVTSEWVITPYNFIRYNSAVDNLRNYGLHPPYFHLLVNGPVYFNILALLFYGRLISLLVGSGMYRLIFATHRVFALMILSTLTPLILFSFIPHQEFRFLLPIIVPLTYAFGFNIYRSNKLSTIWTLINITLVIFYAFIHQAGVLRSVLYMDPIIRSSLSNSKLGDPHAMVNILAFRSYPVPTYMWNIANNESRLYVDTFDTFSDFDQALNTKLRSLISAQRFQVISETDENDTIGTEKHSTSVMTSTYLMLPTLYEDHLIELLDSYINQLYESYTLTDLRRLVPHFSAEDLDMSLQLLRKDGLKSIKKAFGFSLLHLNINNPITYLMNN